MNFIDAAGVLADSAQLLIRDKLAHEAREVVQSVVAAYDALEPDWSEAPGWAQWYAIDTDGKGFWYGVEPAFDFSSGYWRGDADDWTLDRIHDIDSIISVLSPMMLCWQRPESK